MVIKASEQIQAQLNANTNVAEWGSVIYNIKSVYGAKVGGVTDDSVIFQGAIDDLVTKGGGTLLIPGKMLITQSIYFSGSITSSTVYPDLPKINIVGSNNAEIISALASGSIFKLGRSTIKMEFRLCLKNIIIDANQNNVTVIDGNSYVTPANLLVDFEDVTIRNFSGASSIGIDCGDITDSTFFLVRIQGGNAASKGFIPKRSNCKLIECIVQYCANAAYIPQFGEAGLQMIGGQLIYNTNYITFAGGGYTYNVNTLQGVFIGESPTGSSLITFETPVGASQPVISFIGCEFDRPTTATDPMIDCNSGGIFNFIGCNNWYTSGATLVRAEQYAQVNMIGNNNMTLDPTSPGIALANRLFQDVGGDVNATGGFKQTLSFWYDAVPASQSGTILHKNAGTVKSYIVTYTGSILSIAIESDTSITAGTLVVQAAINGTGHASLSAQLDTTNTTKKWTIVAKDSVPLAVGDLISIFLYTDAALAPTTANIGVEVVIEY